MRKISVIPFVFMVSLFCCRFVKSINDTNINEKSIEDSKGTETTTMDTIVTEIMKDAKTTRKTKKMPADVTESSISNSTIENSMDRADIKNTSRSIFLNENIEDYWMNLGSSIHDELMDVQAIVVKDEEIMWRCQTANLKARTRYLICSGSIISDHHVLTSASCLHEATHIRHNIKAPLAVVVAPTKTSSQIIQVQDYVIHPNHQEDPYESNYLDHNLAILKLACRINARNLKKVKMPEFPFTDICGTQNCMVALFRKFDKSSYEMLETIAENIPLSKRKRDQDAVLRSSKVSNVTEGSWIDKKRSNREIRKLIYPPRFGSSFAATGLDRVNRNLKKNSSDIDNTKKANTQSTIVSTTTTAITEKYTRKTEAMETIEKSIIDNNSVNSIMARASDDMRFCPQTGSPVMFGNVQTAVVSVPCDDRQPWRQWGYTDLFVNIDWIKGMVKNWKKMENPAGEDTGNVVCNTCIFNFYMSKGHDQTYERSENPGYNNVITIDKKDNGRNENTMQTVQIRISKNNNKNPIEIYSNFKTPSALHYRPGMKPRLYATIDRTRNRSNSRLMRIIANRQWKSVEAIPEIVRRKPISSA